MILYHGTSTKHLDGILKNGLLPTKETGHEGNYGNEVPSNEDTVYLTDAYAAYYAVGALDEDDDHDPVILAIEVDETSLFPDEDFIAECVSRAEGTEWKEERTKFHPFMHKSLWRESLQHNGVVCTLNCPPGKIVGHRVLPIETCSTLLVFLGYDALPGMTNYLMLGDLYRRSLEALFDADDLSKAEKVILDLHEQEQGFAFS